MSKLAGNNRNCELVVGVECFLFRLNVMSVRSVYFKLQEFRLEMRRYIWVSEKNDKINHNDR